jgi:TRAP-type mannitol/chloroaromatic compound transport system substrate-binding protein
MSKLGVSIISQPGGQIYENLASGAIDATEWVGPYNDFFMKFHEVAKFHYTGAMHEPGGGIAFGMNAEWWHDLSDWEQAVITAACNEELAGQHEETMTRNGAYLKRLVDDHGVQLRAFNDDIRDRFGDAAAEVFAETRDHSGIAARIDNAYQASLRELGGFMSAFEGTFVNQRNRVLGLPG